MYIHITYVYIDVYNTTCKKGDSKQLDWCHTCSNAPRLLRSNWAKHILTWLRSQTVTFEVKNGRSFEANLSIVCRILASLAVHPRVTTHMNLQIMMTWHHVPNIKKGFPAVRKAHPEGSYDTYKLTKTGPHVAKGTNWWYGSGKDWSSWSSCPASLREATPSFQIKIANPKPRNKSIHPHLEGQDFQQKTQKIPSSQVLPHGLPKLEFDWLIDPPPRLGVK